MDLFIAIPFATGLSVISHMDLRHGRVPDLANLLLGLAGLGLSLVQDKIHSSLLAIFTSCAFLLAIALVFRRIRNIDALGGGDIKLAGALGTWVGIGGIAPMILIASSAGLIYLGGLALVGRHITRTTSLRFAPFLCGAALLVWIVQRYDLFWLP